MILNSDLVDVCKALFLCEQRFGNVDNWKNLNAGIAFCRDGGKLDSQTDEKGKNYAFQKRR